MFNRRDLMKVAAGALVAGTLPSTLVAADEPAQRLVADFDAPMFDIPNQIKEPVKIESVELLKRDSNFFVRTRAANGAVGIAPTKTS